MASPKIQIKRNTYVPPYTLSAGEFALNTASENLFVQTGDGSLGVFGSNLVVATTCVFTVQTVTQDGVGTGASLKSNFNIKTTGASLYDGGQLNIGTVLELGNAVDTYVSNFYVTDIVSRTYVSGVLDNTVFSVRQVGTGSGSSLPTANTVLTSFKINTTSGMAWVGAQIDSSMPSVPSYQKLVSQKGMAEYVSTLTAGTVTLSEMTSTTGTYYPIFASSSGNSLLRDVVTSGTVPSYDPSTQILSAIKFSGVHTGSGDFGTVSASGVITSTVTTASTLAPFVVASTVNVANLNASLLNGATFTSGVNAQFGTVSATGQITSTVGQGTAPFVVGSTTKVGSLNASFLDGATFAVPGAIGGTTPGTAAFTSLTTSGTTTINGNLFVNNTQTYLNTTIMQVVDKNIELGVGQSITSGDAYTATGVTDSSTTLTGVQIAGTGGQFSCTDTNSTGTPQTLVVGQLVTISGTLGGTGSISTPLYANPTTYKISQTNGSTTFTLVTLIAAGGAIVTTTGTPTGLTYTIGRRPYFATQGTVSIVSSALLSAKITLTPGSIPVGIRIGSTISGGGVGALANTVTSITPTEIYYTYTSGSAPTAGATTLLAVTNDYTGKVTFTNVGATTAKIAVGATFSCTGFTAVTATVTSVTSDTAFTVSNRDTIPTSGTTAVNSLFSNPSTALTAILIGTNSDSIANGGGFTVKGTTDKTLTWVLDSGRSIGNTKGYFSFNQPLQAYTSLGSANTNLSTLILTANNTNSGTVTNPVASVIEFETITDGSSAKGYFGMRNDRILSYSMNGPGDIIGSSVFSVTSTGLVGDCTIDCGQY